jgi:uncharacterized iron-regulated protein
MARRIAVLLFVLILAGCASISARHDWEHRWEHRLRGDAVVLLGELHDNAEHHRLRLQVLRRAFTAGWRPVIAMEQLDREKQADINRARSEKPRDAQHVIDTAAPAQGTRGGNWNWDYYRPFIALALEHDVPLIAANLSNADISRVVREGYAAVFDASTRRNLGLERPLPQAMQDAQAREIDNGHCKALPAKILPAMARGQMARDAVMADVIARNASRGVVLIAGNGHVRRDLGVPYWLDDTLRSRTLAIGYLEYGKTQDVRDKLDVNAAFDAVVRTAAAARTDPCIDFTRRAKPP